MRPNRGYSSPAEPGKLPRLPAGPAEDRPADRGFLREIQDSMARIRAIGSGPINPPIFYGANVRLAREIGVPVFIDGDTGAVVRTAVAGDRTSMAQVATPRGRFDRWFNAITGCLLNIALLGHIIVTYSAWSGR